MSNLYICKTCEKAEAGLASAGYKKLDRDDPQARCPDCGGQASRVMEHLDRVHFVYVDADGPLRGTDGKKRYRVACRPEVDQWGLFPASNVPEYDVITCEACRTNPVFLSLVPKASAKKFAESGRA